MNGVLPAPLTVFLHFQLPLHHFLVLAGIVINPLAGGAFKLGDMVAVFGCCHRSVLQYNKQRPMPQLPRPRATLRKTLIPDVLC